MFRSNENKLEQSQISSVTKITYCEVSCICGPGEEQEITPADDKELFDYALKTILNSGDPMCTSYEIVKLFGANGLAARLALPHGTIEKIVSLKRPCKAFNIAANKQAAPIVSDYLEQNPEASVISLFNYLFSQGYIAIHYGNAILVFGKDPRIEDCPIDGIFECETLYKYRDKYVLEKDSWKYHIRTYFVKLMNGKCYSGVLIDRIGGRNMIKFVLEDLSGEFDRCAQGISLFL